jgi:hypothetical protein
MLTIPITDVAGRCYPDLLNFDAQGWFIDPFRSADENKGRVTSGLVARALNGLASGRKAFSKSEDWSGALRLVGQARTTCRRQTEDLHAIVHAASKKIETDMREFYQSLLEEHGWKPLSSEAGPQSGAPPAPGAIAAHGSSGPVMGQAYLATNAGGLDTMNGLGSGMNGAVAAGI